MIVNNTVLRPWAIQILQQVADYFRLAQLPAYLVGGSVRNILLHEPCTDWDIAVAADPSTHARQIANVLGGYYAHMHDKASRIVVKHEQQEIIIDLSPLYAAAIDADLQQRDFTINAIAIPFVDAVQSIAQGTQLTLIDPLHGASDITTHIVRAVNATIFQQDPLRLLRAMRFMARYQCTLDALTEQTLTRDATLLTQAAPERIHAELFMLLQLADATRHLRLLDSYGLLEVLIPEFIPARGMLQPGLHNWDVLEHSLEAVSALEYLAKTLQQTPEELQYSPLACGDPTDLLELQKLLFEAEEQQIFQFAALTAPPMKMAALLHDIGKPVTYAADEQGHITFYHHPQAGVPLARQIMRRLGASTQESRLVQQVVAHHMRPGQLSRDTVTPRALRRYFVDLGPIGIAVALVSLADHMAMRGPRPLAEPWQRHLATVRYLLTSYIRMREQILPPHLISAEELIRRFNLERGPIVGQLLEQLAEARADGAIHSKEDAFWFAEEIINQSCS